MNIEHNQTPSEMTSCFAQTSFQQLVIGKNKQCAPILRREKKQHAKLPLSEGLTHDMTHARIRTRDLNHTHQAAFFSRMLTLQVNRDRERLESAGCSAPLDVVLLRLSSIGGLVPRHTINPGTKP